MGQVERMHKPTPSMPRRRFLTLAGLTAGSALSALWGFEQVTSAPSDPLFERRSEIYRQQAELFKQLDERGLVSEGLLASQVVPLDSDPDSRRYYRLEQERNMLENTIRKRDQGKLGGPALVGGIAGVLFFSSLMKRQR